MLIPVTWFTTVKLDYRPSIPLTPISQAWVDGTAMIWTTVKYFLRPAVPLPRGVELEDFRAELISLVNARCAWLDVLCLRQIMQPEPPGLGKYWFGEDIITRAGETETRRKNGRRMYHL